GRHVATVCATHLKRAVLELGGKRRRQPYAEPAVRAADARGAGGAGGPCGSGTDTGGGAGAGGPGARGGRFSGGTWHVKLRGRG
ncbi:hypothetical protein ACWEK7_15285, partial [Streptomyces californicus]